MYICHIDFTPQTSACSSPTVFHSPECINVFNNTEHMFMLISKKSGSNHICAFPRIHTNTTLWA